jgi:hypothetical protein
MRTLARLSSGRVQVSQVAPRFAFGALFLFRGARLICFFECGVNIILSCVKSRDEMVFSHLAYGFTIALRGRPRSRHPSCARRRLRRF